MHTEENQPGSAATGGGGLGIGEPSSFAAAGDRIAFPSKQFCQYNLSWRSAGNPQKFQCSCGGAQTIGQAFCFEETVAEKLEFEAWPNWRIFSDLANELQK